jgi:hypothetical protein
MAWVHREYPDHEGVVVGYVRREGDPSGAELYRELAFPLDADAAARPADCIAGGCRCGWRSPRWSPSAQATCGPFSVLASQDDQERARRLWERHLLIDGGDPRDRAPRFAFMRSAFGALLDRHPALKAAFEADRRELAADLASAALAAYLASAALDVPEARTTVALDELLREHARALAGATDEDRAQLAVDLAALSARLTGRGRPDPR